MTATFESIICGVKTPDGLLDPEFVENHDFVAQIGGLVAMLGGGSRVSLGFRDFSLAQRFGRGLVGLPGFGVHGGGFMVRFGGGLFGARRGGGALRGGTGLGRRLRGDRVGGGFAFGAVIRGCHESGSSLLFTLFTGEACGQTATLITLGNYA